MKTRLQKVDPDTKKVACKIFTFMFAAHQTQRQQCVTSINTIYTKGLNKYHR